MTKTERLKQELLIIQRASPDGILHAGKAVDWASKHKKSDLYTELEWDDSKAAREHRIWQVRRLIQLVIVGEAGEPQVVSLSIDRVKGGGYRSIDDVIKSRDLSAVLLADAIAELERVRTRYGLVKQLTSVWNEFDRVVSREKTRSKKAA